MPFIVKKNQASSNGRWVVKGSKPVQNRPPVQESEKYKRAVAEAERYKQEAEKAKSPLGFAWNAVKALPRAIGDTLVGTPAKFVASTAEVPGVLLRGGKTTQREYKIPGLSPFKSYQSDFEKTAGDVIEGRAGLGKAAWEMAKVPLAGLEMYGLGKGAQNVVKSGSILARTPSKQAAKELAYDIADTFLPTTRGIKTSGATERKLRETLSDLQMQRMRASLAVDRPRPDQYASGVRGKLVSKVISQKKLPEAHSIPADNLINERIPAHLLPDRTVRNAEQPIPAGHVAVGRSNALPRPGMSIEDVSKQNEKFSKASIERLFGRNEVVQIDGSYGNVYYQVKGTAPSALSGLKKNIQKEHSLVSLSKESTVPSRITGIGTWSFDNKTKALRLDNGSVVQKQFVDEILKRYPDAKPFVGSYSKEMPVAFRVGDEVVGVVMPIKSSDASIIGEKSFSTFQGSRIRPENTLDQTAGIPASDLGRDGMSIEAVDDTLLNEARKYKSAEEFVNSYEQRFHQTSPESVQSIEQGGFILDKLGSGNSDVLPVGVNTKSHNRELLIQGKGAQLEVAFPKSANVKKFETRAQAESYFRMHDSPEGLEYYRAYQKYNETDKKYAEILRKEDDVQNELVKQKAGRKAILEHIDKQEKIIDEWDKEGMVYSKKMQEMATKIAKNEGIDVIEIAQDAGGFGRMTDNTIILNPELLKTKSQLTDIWKKANQALPVDANNIVTNFSGETTTPKINYRKFIEENLGIKDRRPDTRGFDSKIAMLEKELKRPDLFVSDLANRGARTFSAPRRMIASGSRILRESGLGGRALEQLIRKQQLDADLMTGGYNKRISEALSGLSKAERTNVTDVLEGTAKPLSQKAQEAAMKMRSLYDEIAGEATKREFTIRTPEGVDVPFRPRENYAPRMYNWDDFTKGRRREEALQHLVDTGQARNKAEAAKALDAYIKENAQRRAGNIENARMFDLPGYEKDAEIAARAYAQRAAERFTQADIFGKNDEVPAALINKIANEGGDYEEAQRVFDFLFQGLPKSKVASAITQFNLATKLDLGAITNITQSVNTATKAGILNTAKAIFKGFTKEGKDLAELANVYDEMVIVQETGMKMNRFVRAVMKPFQIVERFNRRTAGMAGKLRAEQLAKILQKNPESSIAIRQMKTLGIDPAKIINGKLSGEDVLIAANRMSELTQFKPNVLNTPVAWRTPLGRVLMQFKSFAYMQTRFITDEIAKEAKQGNVAPLLRFILLAGIISPLTYETRNLVAGRDESDTKKSLDTRKFDKYFGAGKSFYTEPFTQGAFLGETYMNPNATSMKKLARTIGTFGGPTAGEVGNTLTSLESADRTNTVNKNWYAQHELAQDDPWLMAKRQAAGTIPFVGEYLKNTAFGFKDTPAEQAESIIKDGIKNGDFNKIAEGLSIDPYYKKPGAFRNLIKEVSQETAENEKDQELFYELQKRKLKPFFTP